MLYILKNKIKQSAWQIEYERLYQKGLDEIGYSYKIVKEIPGKLTNKDFVWVMHYSDINRLENCKAKIISQVNGTSVNPFIYQVKEKEEKYQVRNIIDIPLVFNRKMREDFEKKFNKRAYVVGFPIEVPSISHKRKVKNSIVVAGRISPDKQFYLAIFLLKDLLSDYNITFCITPKSYKEWKDFYDISRFKKMGFKIIPCSRNKYLRILAKSKFYFTCSLGDTFSVSLIEAIKLGCIPIVPYSKDMPTYYPVSNGYEPFSKNSIIELLISPPDYICDLESIEKKTNYKECTKLLVNILENEISS